MGKTQRKISLICAIVYCLTNLLSTPVFAVSSTGAIGSVPKDLKFTSDKEWKLMELVNIIRYQEGVDSLVTSNLMQEIASVRAEEATIKNKNSETIPVSPSDVFKRFGMEHPSVAECFGNWSPSPKSAIKEWNDSPVRKAAVMDIKKNFFGAGFSSNNAPDNVAGVLNAFWSQLFVELPSKVATDIRFDEKNLYFTILFDDGTVAYAPYNKDSVIIKNDKMAFPFQNLKNIYFDIPEEFLNPFVDVEKHIYYEKAVLWALKEGIASGTTKTTFEPEKICTRAQVMTFLWRANGSPEPTHLTSPFMDVDVNSYYYKPVLWAVEQGITTGTSKNTFSPNLECRTVQFITFLHNSKNKPIPTGCDEIVKMYPKIEQPYINAIAWAHSAGLINYENNNYPLNGLVTRADAVYCLMLAK